MPLEKDLETLAACCNSQRLRAIVVEASVCPQEPDELFEVISQCLLAGTDRDAISGWGAIVHVMYAPRHASKHWWTGPASHSSCI